MMDSIQLTLNSHLKKTYQKNTIFNIYPSSEASFSLLLSYLIWIRAIKGCPNKTDLMDQNEQSIGELKFFCQHNLLFFLTITGQFDVIDKLFSIPPYAIRLQHFITLLIKEHCIIKQTKKEHLLQWTHQQENLLRSHGTKKTGGIVDSTNRHLGFLHFLKKLVHKEDKISLQLTKTSLSDNYEQERTIASVQDHSTRKKLNSLNIAYQLNQQQTFFPTTEFSNKSGQRTLRSHLNFFGGRN